MGEIRREYPSVTARLRRFGGECAAFARFAGSIPAADRRLVFFAEHGDYHAYFAELIDEIARRYDSRFVYLTADAGDPILRSHPPAIIPFHFDSFLPSVMSSLATDVCVMTMTDLDHVSIRRSAHPVHYVYAFHSLISTHVGYRADAFDAYDAILCAGPHHVEEIRRREAIYGLLPKTLVEAGYERLEHVHRAACDSAASRPEGSRPAVLIAPSWGSRNIIEEVGGPLVASLLDAGFAVILRPHPETLKRDATRVDALEREFGHRPGFVLERSVASIESFVRADVMISDVSGAALEYALGTARPVLFLDVPFRKVRNEDWRDLGIEPLEVRLRDEIGVVVPPDAARAARAVSDLIARRHEFARSLAELRTRLVFSFGRSATIGADYILGVLNRGTVRSDETIPSTGINGMFANAESNRHRSGGPTVDRRGS